MTTLNGGASENSNTLDPSKLTTPEEFGAALTALRDRLGLSIRQVARTTDIPNATLGGYFTGRHLPPPTQPQILSALLEALQIPRTDHAAWREASIRLRRVPGPRTVQTPYRGLESYQADDADFYVGREEQVEQLLALMAGFSTGPRCITVVGSSGSGKSSLLHAGLIARVRAQGLTALSFSPRESSDLGDLAEEQFAGQRVIVIDQFEQALADDVDEDQKGRLFTAIQKLAHREDTVIVIGLRADFYAKALLEPTLLPLMSSQVPVGPMTHDQFARVISEPAARVNHPVEPAFVDLVLRDLSPRGTLAESTQLPLVSHALLMTWEHGRGRGLTAASYAAIGGVAGAVQATAEDAYGSLNEDARAAARRLFELMFLVDADGTALRRPALYGDIKDDPDMVDAAEAFVAHRILTATASAYAISHESLATAWPRLAEWLETDQERARIRRLLASAAGSWDEHGRSEDGLIRGMFLADAEALADSETPITAVESALVSASRQAADVARNRDRRSRTRLRVIAICALALAVATTVLSAYLIKSRNDITQERDQALSRQVAEQAALLRPTDPALSAQLALVAYQIAPTLEARSVLLEATGERLVTRILGAPGPMRATPSPDGRLLAAVTSDGALRLFVMTSGRAPQLISTISTNGGQLYGAAWSADSRLLAVGGTGATVTIYNVTSPSHPTALLTLPASGGVENLRFDGLTLYAATGAPSLLRWRIEGAQATELPTTSNFGGQVNDVAVSSRGIVATASSDGAVRLWQTTGDRLKLRQKISLASPNDFAFSVAFSPDGHYLAETEKAKVTRVFDIDGTRARQVATLGGFTSWVNSVAFSPDGRSITAGASGSLMQTWAVGSWRHQDSFTTPSAVTTVAYSADGTNLILGTLDGTTLLLPAASHRPPTYADSIWTVDGTPNGEVYLGAGSQVDGIPALNVSGRTPVATGTFTGPASSGGPDGSASTSPDGRWLGTGTASGDVMFWNPSSARDHPIVLPAASKLIEYSAFSPDSRLFAATSDDGTIPLFDVSGARPRKIGALHIAAQGFGVAFSPNGSLLAVGGTDNAVHLFRVSSGKEIATLKGFANYVYGVAFSPNSKYLAGSSTDKTVRIWDITNPERPRPLPQLGRGPTDAVYTLAWNTTGTHLLGASQDGNIWIWSTSSQGASPWAKISNLGAGATAAAYLPSGRIVGVGMLGAVDFWDSDVATATRDICSSAGSAITLSEWKLYVPGASYRRPCGAE